jgi:hypothetical protein
MARKAVKIGQILTAFLKYCGQQRDVEKSPMREEKS